MNSVCVPDPSEDEALVRLQHAQVREWLTEAILLLPEKERLVFTLHYYEKLTTREIQQLLGSTELGVSELYASTLSRIHSSLSNRANRDLRSVMATGKIIQ